MENRDKDKKRDKVKDRDKDKEEERNREQKRKRDREQKKERDRERAGKSDRERKSDSNRNRSRNIIRSRKINIDKNIQNGYMTLEAALLFPIIFTSIVLLIYLSFFIYDRCRLENSAYIAALRGSRMITEENEEIYEEVSRLATELVEGHLIAARDVTQHVEVSMNEVKVSYTARVVPPYGTLLMQMVNRDIFKIKAEEKASKIRILMNIRAFRKAEALLEGAAPEEGIPVEDGR